MLLCYRKLHPDADNTILIFTKLHGKLSFVISGIIIQDSLFRPRRNLCEDGAAVEEVKDDDRHDDGDGGHGHHKRKIYTCEQMDC